MPQIEEIENGNCQNMVSNLPLLFAAGYPTSLEKITEPQLEKFIPFMVHCSLGYIQMPTLTEYSEPEWWPEDLDFTVPFCKPKSFKGNWLEKMRELVVICYSFHKCVFLLRFCTDLASYEPATLRFINNYNSTTSLFQRRTNKLLVTFRNENMLYDHEPTNNRKCLLPKNSSSQQANTVVQEQMVEPALFDIYLCDDCDAELYSYDAYVEHEKTCLKDKDENLNDSDDDDVIFCDEVNDNTEPEPDQNQLQMSSFLSNFNLVDKNKKPGGHMKSQSSSCSNSNNIVHINILDGSPEKLRRLPRRSRGVVTLSKCTSIPLSSPCGQFLIKKTKTAMSKDYQLERLDRIERFCHAPPLVKDGTVVTNRPKWMHKSKPPSCVNVSYKRPSDGPLEPYHQFKFPRRQFSSTCRDSNFKFYNSLLLKKCKPFAIQIQRLTMHDIENRIIDLRLKGLNNKEVQSEKVEPKDCSLDDVLEFIDLCSSDEEEEEKKFVSTTTNNKRIVFDNFQQCRNSVIQLGMDIANSGSGGNQMNFNLQLDNCISNLANHEANFLLNLANNNNNHNALQPLRPSVYLFSNIKKTPANVFNEIQASNNTFYISNQENLTEIKENRVNDWLNETSATIDAIQTHVNTATFTTSSSSASLLTTTNTNSRRSMPSLVKLSRASTTEPIRQRAAIAANGK